MNRRTLRVCLALAAAALLAGCGYNRIQQQDEAVKAAWSQVINQYQRRADLVPNLVNVVKGVAAQEQTVFLGVAAARSRVGSIQVTPAMMNDPQALRRFDAAQGQLSAALGRLIAVSENYPQLKSDQNFRDLQAQLEGTENRIAVARMRYIHAVEQYNVLIRSFPSNLTARLFHYSVRPNFSVRNEAEISHPPAVQFAGPSVPPGLAPAH